MQPNPEQSSQSKSKRKQRLEELKPRPEPRSDQDLTEDEVFELQCELLESMEEANSFLQMEVDRKSQRVTMMEAEVREMEFENKFLAQERDEFMIRHVAREYLERELEVMFSLRNERAHQNQQRLAQQNLPQNQGRLQGQFFLFQSGNGRYMFEVFNRVDQEQRAPIVNGRENEQVRREQNPERNRVESFLIQDRGVSRMIEGINVGRLSEEMNQPVVGGLQIRQVASESIIPQNANRRLVERVLSEIEINLWEEEEERINHEIRSEPNRERPSE